MLGERSLLGEEPVAGRSMMKEEHVRERSVLEGEACWGRSMLVCSFILGKEKHWDKALPLACAQFLPPTPAEAHRMNYLRSL